MSEQGQPPGPGGFGPPPGHPGFGASPPAAGPQPGATTMPGHAGYGQAQSGPSQGSYGAPGQGGYGPPPGQGGYGPPGMPPAPTGPRTDTLAIVALIGGLIAIVGALGNLISGAFGMCCPLCTIGGAIIGAIVAIPALLGLVCGILSYRRTTEQPQELQGKGIALTGAITGGVAIAMTVVTVIGPWLGWGCLSATAPRHPPGQPGYDPFAYDAGPMPSFDPSFDPIPDPTIIDPSDPSAPPTDPTLPPPSDPSAGGAPIGECARLAPCCRAYAAEMGALVPAGTCDAYDNVTGMTDDLCAQTIAGYRAGLTALRRPVPVDCN